VASDARAPSSRIRQPPSRLMDAVLAPRRRTRSDMLTLAEADALVAEADAMQIEEPPAAAPAAAGAHGVPENEDAGDVYGSAANRSSSLRELCSAETSPPLSPSVPSRCMMQSGTIAHRQSMTRFRECSFYSWRCVNSLMTDCLPVSEHLCDLMTASNSLALCNADGHAFPSRPPSLQPSTRMTVRRSLQRMADFLTIFALLLGFREAQTQDEGVVQFYNKPRARLGR
jgi:hypothetical protein